MKILFLTYIVVIIIIIIITSVILIRNWYNYIFQFAIHTFQVDN
jgi:hypothetical protein